ncbi:MAG: type VI secretion system baseplate subunit TssE [Planctomycetota bacterium]
MSREHPLTLFERLQHAPSRHIQTMAMDADAHKTSIVGNLQRVLNTRLGSAAAQPDLGVPAPHEILINYPASLNKVLAAITNTIETYEPRLQRVRVYHLPPDEDDRLTLRFRITGAVTALGGARIGLETAVDQSGRFNCGS